MLWRGCKRHDRSRHAAKRGDHPFGGPRCRSGWWLGGVLVIAGLAFGVPGRAGRVRLHEKGGKEHEVPCHHNLEQYLDAYIAGRSQKGVSVMEIRFNWVVPILRIFDIAKADEFYQGFLGFAVDWDHRYDPARRQGPS